MKRWKAIVWYRTENGPLAVTHDIEEIEELHDLVERGPHWDTIIDITINLSEPSEYGLLTVERAQEL